MMYNNSAMSLYTPPRLFPIDDENIKLYNSTTELGKRYASQNTAVVCTLVRDVEHKIPAIIKKAEAMGKLFADYRILLVENDSSDNTRKLLLEWKNKNPRVTILGCGVNFEGKCSVNIARKKTDEHAISRWRIEKMVYLRNIYLNYLKKHYSNFDYALVWDADTIGSVYLDGILNSMGWFAKNPEMEGVCANGIKRFVLPKVFYDTYAINEHTDNFHSDNMRSHHYKKAILTQYSRGEPLAHVKSCFSGFTIYRIDSLLNDDVVYDMSEGDNIECEHVRLHKHMNDRMYINPSMINYVVLND